VSSLSSFQELLPHFLRKKERSELLDTETTWKIFVRSSFQLDEAGWVEMSMDDNCIGTLDSLNANCVRFFLSPRPPPPRPRNAFSVLMDGAKKAAASVLPAPETGETMDAALYNDLLKLLEVRNSTFHSASTGKLFLSALRDLLWTLEPSLDTITHTTGKSFPFSPVEVPFVKNPQL
jgi:hypothetical protein